LSHRSVPRAERGPGDRGNAVRGARGFSRGKDLAALAVPLPWLIKAKGRERLSLDAGPRPPGRPREAEMGVGILSGRSPPPFTAASSVTHILHRSHPQPRCGVTTGRGRGLPPNASPRGAVATLASSPFLAVEGHDVKVAGVGSMPAGCPSGGRGHRGARGPCVSTAASFKTRRRGGRGGSGSRARHHVGAGAAAAARHPGGPAGPARPPLQPPPGRRLLREQLPAGAGDGYGWGQRGVGVMLGDSQEPRWDAGPGRWLVGDGEGSARGDGSLSIPLRFLPSVAHRWAFLLPSCLSFPFPSQLSVWGLG